VKAGVAGYFRDPSAMHEAGAGRGVLPGARAGTTGERQEAAPTVESATAALEKAAQHLREALKALPDFDKIKDRIEIHVTPDGLLIELLEGPKDGFFDSGSATLKAETIELLDVIGHELAQLGHKIVVDGHTDKRPYSSANGYTNWELSADRANAARHVLQGAGITEEQLEAVRGYADTRLRFADKPFDPGNRRISILVRR
jgi:chemotaxis protein MotB